MDEIHLQSKKFTELESKLIDVESKLAEKDAMIKVLQRHTENRDAITLVRRFPNRHTRSASTMGLLAGNSINSSPVNTSDALSGDFSKLLVSNASQRSNHSMSSNLILKSECTEPGINNIDQQIESRLSPKVSN